MFNSRKKSSYAVRATHVGSCCSYFSVVWLFVFMTGAVQVAVHDLDRVGKTREGFARLLKSIGDPW